MYGIIVNPVSGSRRHDELVKQIIAMLEKRGACARVLYTEAEGDGERQAQLALDDGCEAVVCVGGDGTLSEVVRAMAGRETPLYIVPNGTGNDFVRALGLSLEPIAAFRRQLNGRAVRVDCGSINGHPFVNVAGSGFDVEVLRKTEELKAVYPGAKAYRKAIAAVLGSYRAFEAEVSLDDGREEHVCATIVEVANGQYIGGGMRVAPGADYRDGLFDVVFVRRVPRPFIPFLLPLFILGVHVFLPVARVARAKKVTLRAPGMVVNIDGRLKAMDEAHFEILPGAITMML